LPIDFKISNFVIIIIIKSEVKLKIFDYFLKNKIVISPHNTKTASCEGMISHKNYETFMVN